MRRTAMEGRLRAAYALLSAALVVLAGFAIDAGQTKSEAEPARQLIEAARKRGLPVLTQDFAGTSGLRHYASLPGLMLALEELSRSHEKRGGAQ